MLSRALGGEDAPQETKVPALAPRREMSYGGHAGMREAVLVRGAGLAVAGLLESALGNPCSEPALRPAAARPRSPSRPSAWCLVGRPRGRLWSNLDPLLRLEGAPSHKQQRNCIRQGNLGMRHFLFCILLWSYN